MCRIDWSLLLEYLKVIFSWPPVLAMLLIWFVRRFNVQISKLLDRIKGVKLPGGSELILIEIEKQQEAATPPDLFPSAADSSTSGAGSADLTVPMATLEAHGHASPTPNRAYSGRVGALYPSVNADAVVEWMHLNPGPSLDDYVDKVFQLQCERTFNIIFGTQVLVLAYLENPVLTEPLPGSALAPLFARHVELTGGTPGRQFSDFLGFLVNSGYIQNVGTAEGPLYQITASGREFLKYIRQYYPLVWNEKPF
jgi:hypothetical protein